MKTNITLTRLHKAMRLLSTVNCRIDWTKVTDKDKLDKWVNKVNTSLKSGDRQLRETPISYYRLYSAMWERHPELMQNILDSSK